MSRLTKALRDVERKTEDAACVLVLLLCLLPISISFKVKQETTAKTIFR